MWREIEPDERYEIDVDGYKVIAYSFGSGDETVFCLNGGPGLPCDYLREAHSCLVDKGYRVVAFDQLGTGASDRPDDAGLWTIGRYVEETETVRKALGLGKVHMLGHSWGGWLAIDYALTYPGKPADADPRRHRRRHAASDPGTRAVARSARTGNGVDDAEARGAGHLRPPGIPGCRDHPELPPCLPPAGMAGAGARSLDDWNMGPYATMQGPNEFLYIGNLKDWNRIPDLPRVTVPTLITTGEHDELTPACALRMKLALPNAELKVFANASHMPFYENPGDYYPALLDFLSRHKAAE
jgi:proline iminopeptidase